MNDLEKKKNKHLILLVIVLLIIILCLVGYICFNKVLFLNNNTINDNIQNSINDENGEETQEDNAANNNDDDEKKDNDIISELNLSKCLNNDGNLYSNPSDVVGSYGLSFEINQDKKSITMSVNNDIFMPIVNQVTIGSTWEPNSTSVYQVKGFTKNVVDVFIGELGQSAVGTTLFFLMEDGTVEYTLLFLSNANSDGTTYYDLNFTHDYTSDLKITDTYFVSMGTVTGVKDTIKFYNVDVTTSDGFGHRTAIAVRKDGSFYDLGKII